MSTAANITTEVKSIGYLRCHVTYCRWWVSIRNIWSIYRLPSPLFTEAAYKAWLEGMELAASAASDMINRCLLENWRLGRLPAAFGNAIVLCYAALSTGLSHFERHFPFLPLPTCLDVQESLSAIERHIQNENAVLAKMIKDTNERLQEYRRHLATQRNGCPTDIEGLSQWQGFGDVSTAVPFDMSGVTGERGQDVTNPSDMLAGMENWWNWTFTDFEAMLHQGELV